MASELDALPQSMPRGGQEFNYSVWTPGTRITLHNVPWSADYRDVVDFNDQAALDAYLFSKEHTFVEIRNMTYLKPNEPIRIHIPYNSAFKFNYIRVENPMQPVAGDRKLIFYYFIGDLRYVAPNTTEIAVMLDVWETFRWGLRFGNCYVERGHIGIAQVNAFSNSGRDLLLQPEGMDYGNEYVTVKSWAQHVGNTSDVKYFIFSNIELATDYGTVDNPSLSTAIGSQAENLPSGMSIYVFSNQNELGQYLQDVSNAPWVSQGIVSIVAVPTAVELSTQALPYVCPDAAGNSKNGTIKMLTALTPTRPVTITKNLIVDMMGAVLGSGRYKHLNKFLTYPYTFLEATSYTGTPLVIKPECLQTRDLRFIEMTHLVQPSPRVSYGLYGYNTDERGAGPVVGTGGANAANTPNAFESSSVFDMQTGFFDFPQFSTVNNSYVNFMASNRNGIAYQYSSADWSQQKALAGNQLGYNQATAGIALNDRMTHLGNSQAMWTAGINGGLGVAKAGAGVAMAVASEGALAGPALGLVASGAGAVENVGMTAMNNHYNNERRDAQNQNTAYMRDTNKAYGDWAAKGDYALAIQGIQAKCQDAKLTPPTSVGQVGGDAFMLAVNRWVLSVKLKTIQTGAMFSIGEFWLRYGYAINRFYNFSSHGFSMMSKFTYWKVSETYITRSDIPESFKNAIRGILEKGVTMWRNPDDIGNIDIADNEPVFGHYLNEKVS